MGRRRYLDRPHADLAQPALLPAECVLSRHNPAVSPTHHDRIADYEKQMAAASRLFLWTTPRFYPPLLYARKLTSHAYLERVGGPFDAVDPVITAALPAMKVLV